jgi:hypothetical protein
MCFILPVAAHRRKQAHSRPGMFPLANLPG